MSWQYMEHNSKYLSKKESNYPPDGSKVLLYDDKDYMVGDIFYNESVSVIDKNNIHYDISEFTKWLSIEEETCHEHTR